MNNQTISNLGYLAMALTFLPMTYKNCFENKSHKDFRNPSSLT